MNTATSNAVHNGGLWRSRRAVAGLLAAVTAALMLNLIANPAWSAGEEITADNASVTVDEGQTAKNSGTFEDTNASPVEITASVGTVTQTGSGAGTWEWSYDASDGPTQNQTVTITSTRLDSGKDPVSVRFLLGVNNLAPTATLNAPASVKEGGTFAVSLDGTTDPGPGDRDTLKYAFDCGSGYGALSENAGVSCDAGSVLGNKTVKGKVVDKDGAENEYAATVAVTDATLPTIRIVSPKPNSTIKAGNPAVVKAVVKDSVTNLSKANVKVYVNGKAVPAAKYKYNRNSDVLTYSLQKPSVGKKTVKIIATDEAKNAGVKSWSFKIGR